MALLSQHVFLPFNFRFRSTHTGCLIPPPMSVSFFSEQYMYVGHILLYVTIWILLNIYQSATVSSSSEKKYVFLFPVISPLTQHSSLSA